MDTESKGDTLKVYNSITGEFVEIADQKEAERWIKSCTPWCEETPNFSEQLENKRDGNSNHQATRKLSVELTNCYGINQLRHSFVFTSEKNRSFAIYAPNGMMKTSFSKTFEDLSKGDFPKEERYNRATACKVAIDGVPIASEEIYVLKAEIDISSDSPSITNILVDPRNKARYDELLIDLDKLKSKLIKELSKSSGLKQTEIEQKILYDFEEKDFLSCIQKAQDVVIDEDLSPYIYAIIFDPRAISVLNSREFSEKAKEFNQRYQELFEQEGSIYQKGVFNPNKAETSFKTLNKYGFFAGGHRVLLRGDESSLNREELDEKLKAIHSKIDGDADLKKIKTGLSKNAQADALAGLIENLSASEFDYMLERLKSGNQSRFRMELWAYYIQKAEDAMVYLKSYEKSKDEIRQIEDEAELSAPRWEKVQRSLC